MDSKNLLFVVKLQEVIFQYLQEQCLPDSDLAHADLFISALKKHAFGFEFNKVKSSSEDGPIIMSSQTITNFEEGIENVKSDVEESCEAMDEVGEVETLAITSKLEPLALEDHTDTSQRYGGLNEDISDQKSSIIKEIIRCSFCEVDFENREDANSHDNENHIVNGQMKCSICDFYENDKKILVKHFLKTHKKVPCFDCNDCDEFFLSLDELRGHKFKAHNIKVRGRTCLICYQVIKDSTLLHMYKEHLSMEFPCKVCQRVFNAPSALKTHVENMHEGEKKPCSICGKEVLEKRFKIHLERHQLRQGAKTVKCTECDGMYYHKTEMQQHRKDCHSTDLKVIKCPECDYSTTRGTNMHRHMFSHSKERKYKCDQCELSFKDPYRVSIHKKVVHIGLRNYKCDYCPKAFKGQEALKRHLDIHLGKYRAQCEHCGMKFVQKGNYKLHLKTKHNIDDGLVNLLDK